MTHEEALKKANDLADRHGLEGVQRTELIEKVLPQFLQRESAPDSPTIDDALAADVTVRKKDIEPESLPFTLKQAPDPDVDLNSAYRFPTDGLPPRFLDFCHHVADRCNVPDECVILPAMMVAGCVMGPYVSSKIDGLHNCANLYGMIVGDSTAGKSAPLKVLMAPVKALDSRLVEEYNARRESWNAANAKNVNAAGKPKKTQIICAAETDAARFDFLVGNPRGGIAFYNEGEEYFESLGGKFSKRAIATANNVFDNEEIKHDTAGGEQVKKSEKPFLTVLGGIQPDNLKEHLKPNYFSSGLFNRFIFIPLESDNFLKRHGEIDGYQIEYWSRLLESLKEFGNVQRTFGLMDEQSYFAGLADMRKTGLKIKDDGSRRNRDIRAMTAKSLYHVHRFALIAHVLNIAENGFNNPYSGISSDTVRWAFSTIPYIVAQKTKIYDMAKGAYKPPTDKQIAQMMWDWSARKGIKLNQSALAEVMGIKRSNLNAYLKEIR